MLAQKVILEEVAELLAYGLTLQLALQGWLGTRLRCPGARASGVGMAGMGDCTHGRCQAGDTSACRSLQRACHRMAHARVH